jgi:hypothetical protein
MHAIRSVDHSQEALVPRSSSILCGALALLIAPVLAACSSGSGTTASARPSASASAAVTAATAVPSVGAVTAPAAPSPSASVSYPTTDAAPGAAVPLVRDAFAVLQATYNDGCGSPGNCEYFLNRLLDNLDDLDNAMKASSEGPKHFAKPLAWITQMQTALGSDFSFANLKKHQSLLVGTRDKINSWMQSYPEDYR